MFLCLFRLKEGFNFSKSCTGDNIFTFSANSKRNTPEIPIRIIQVTLNNGSKEYLATNVFSQNITQAMFKDLYFLRWPIETKYNELKTSFVIEEFSGATKTSIFQEFFITLLLSNLCSLIKNEADIKISETANKTNKYEYQANRNFIIGSLEVNLPKILSGALDISKIEIIYSEALRCKSQILLGRSYPRRKNKMIGRKHYRNRKVTR